MSLGAEVEVAFGLKMILYLKQTLMNCWDWSFSFGSLKKAATRVKGSSLPETGLKISPRLHSICYGWCHSSLWLPQSIGKVQPRTVPCKLVLPEEAPCELSRRCVQISLDFCHLEWLCFLKQRGKSTTTIFPENSPSQGTCYSIFAQACVAG